MAASDGIAKDHVYDREDLNFTSIEQLALDTTTTVPDAAETYVTSRSVFVFFLIVGTASNCCLIATIVRRRRQLRSACTKSVDPSAFTSTVAATTSASLPPQLEYLIVGVLSTSNLINCIVNGAWLTYTIIAVAIGLRSSSSLWCGIDGAFVQLVSLVYIVGLMFSLVDRYVAVRSSAAVSDVGGTAAEMAVDFTTPQDHRHGFTVGRTVVLIALAWMYAISFSVPLAVPVESGGVEVDADGGRYLCTVSASSSRSVYAWTTAVVGYLCPISVGLFMSVGCAVVACRAHRKQSVGLAYASDLPSNQSSMSPTKYSNHWRHFARRRTPNQFSTSSSASSSASASTIQETAALLAYELSVAKYTVALGVTWCLMVGAPYLLLSFIRSISTGSLTPGNVLVRWTFTYSSANAVVTWLFLSHPIVLPLITYIWMKKHAITNWCQSYCCCCQTAAATSGSICDTIAASHKIPQSHWRRQKTSPKHRQRVGISEQDDSPSKHTQAGVETDFVSSPRTPTCARYPVATIPVLFATSDGLHIHRPVNDCSPSLTVSLQQIAHPINSSTTATSTTSAVKRNHVAMIAVQCDVFGSFYSTDLLDDDDDDDNSQVGDIKKQTEAVSSRDGVGVDDAVSGNTSDYDSGDSSSIGDELPATSAVIAVKTTRTRCPDRDAHVDGTVTVHRVSCAVEMELRDFPRNGGKNRTTARPTHHVTSGHRRVAKPSVEIPDDEDNVANKSSTTTGRSNSSSSGRLNDACQSKLCNGVNVRAGAGETMVASGGTPIKRGRVGTGKGRRGGVCSDLANPSDTTEQAFPALASTSRETVLATVYGGSRTTKPGSTNSDDTELVQRTSSRKSKVTTGDKKKTKLRKKTTESGTTLCDDGNKMSGDQSSIVEQTIMTRTIRAGPRRTSSKGSEGTEDNRFDSQVDVEYGQIEWQGGMSTGPGREDTPKTMVIATANVAHHGVSEENGEQRSRYQNARRPRARQTSESQTNLLSPLDSSTGSMISSASGPTEQ